MMAKNQAPAKGNGKQAAPAAKPAKIEPHSCGCGCGGTVLTKATYLVGHDAKLKSQLVEQALGSDRAAASSATQRLEKLGWTSHLEKSRASRAGKAERAATRERERADKAHEAEAAKAKQPAGATA